MNEQCHINNLFQIQPEHRVSTKRQSGSPHRQSQRAVPFLQEETVNFKRRAQPELAGNHREAARSPTAELQGETGSADSICSHFQTCFYIEPRGGGHEGQEYNNTYSPPPPRLYIAHMWKVGGMCPDSDLHFAQCHAGLETKQAKLKEQTRFKSSWSPLRARLHEHLWTFPSLPGCPVQITCMTSVKHRLLGQTDQTSRFTSCNFILSSERNSDWRVMIRSQWKVSSMQLRCRVQVVRMRLTGKGHRAGSRAGSGSEVHKEAILKSQTEIQ